MNLFLKSHVEDGHNRNYHQEMHSSEYLEEGDGGMNSSRESVAALISNKSKSQVERYK